MSARLGRKEGRFRVQRSELRKQNYERRQEGKGNESAKKAEKERTNEGQTDRWLRRNGEREQQKHTYIRVEKRDQTNAPIYKHKIKKNIPGWYRTKQQGAREKHKNIKNINKIGRRGFIPSIHWDKRQEYY